MAAVQPVEVELDGHELHHPRFGADEAEEPHQLRLVGDLVPIMVLLGFVRLPHPLPHALVPVDAQGLGPRVLPEVVAALAASQLVAWPLLRRSPQPALGLFAARRLPVLPLLLVLLLLLVQLEGGPERVQHLL